MYAKESAWGEKKMGRSGEGLSEKREGVFFILCDRFITNRRKQHPL